MAATGSDDVLETSYEGETLRGLAGNDRLSSVFNSTTLIGDAGDDVLVTAFTSQADEAAATQYGNDGNDVLSANVQSAGFLIEIMQDGGDGDDQITASAFLDYGNSFSGDFVIATVASGGNGNDTLQLSAILNIDSGTARNEALGGSGNDRISAFAATNFYGTQSTALNLIDGGDGNDVISASASGTSNYGDLAANELIGGAGDDVIRGYVFTDSNSSDAYGRNLIDGGEGNDVLEAYHDTDGENTYTDLESILIGGVGDDELVARSTALADIGLGGTSVVSHQLSGGADSDNLNSSIFAEAATVRIDASLLGGQGDDRLLSSVEVELSSSFGSDDPATVTNRLDGGEGNDILEARISITRYQDPYDDVIADSNVASELYGGDGDDILTAVIESYANNPGSTVAASSFLFGGAGNDFIRVEGGDDNILHGGAGNDRLVGGSGSDTFVFEFAISPAETQTVYFRNGETPNWNANVRAWENYLNQLSDWRSDLKGYGNDLDNLLSVVSLTGRRGAMGKTFLFDNSYTYSTGTVIAGDGWDLVEGFSEDDVLKLNGLTQSEFFDLFDVSVADYDEDGTLDTVLTWSESDGGVVLLGVQYESLADLTTAGIVIFG